MPVTRTVKLKDFSRELQRHSKATLQQQRMAVANALARAIPRLVAASPVDTGLYAQSWSFTIDEEKAIIGNYAPHAVIIEDGARPHMPPLEPLLAWAKRVLKDPSQPPDYSPKVQAMARAVQMKIYHYGQKPLHILQNEMPNILQDIALELRKYG